MTLVIRNDGSGLFLFPELLLTSVPTGHGVPKYHPGVPRPHTSGVPKNSREKCRKQPEIKAKVRKIPHNLPFYKGKEERKR